MIDEQSARTYTLKFMNFINIDRLDFKKKLLVQNKNCKEQNLIILHRDGTVQENPRPWHSLKCPLLTSGT